MHRHRLRHIVLLRAEQDLLGEQSPVEDPGHLAQDFSILVVDIVSIVDRHRVFHVIRDQPPLLQVGLLLPEKNQHLPDCRCIERLELWIELIHQPRIKHRVAHPFQHQVGISHWGSHTCAKDGCLWLEIRGAIKMFTRSWNLLAKSPGQLAQRWLPFSGSSPGRVKETKGSGK